MAYYDAPASVDHILNTTGLKTISWVGISMGNGIAMAFLSSRPEYNEKIDIWFAMAAALTLKNTKYVQFSRLENEETSKTRMFKSKYFLILFIDNRHSR